MALAKLMCLSLLALVYPLTVVAKPAGGKVQFRDIYLEAVEQKNTVVYQTGVCKEIGLYNGSTIEISMYHKATSIGNMNNDKVKVPFHIHVKVFKATCANTIGDDIPEEACDVNLEPMESVMKVEKVAESISPVYYATNGWSNIILHGNNTRYLTSPSSALPATTPSTTTTIAKNGNDSTDVSAPSANNTSHSVSTRSLIPRETANATSQMHPNGQQQQPTVFEIRDGNAMYIVQALIIRNLDLQKTEENGSLYVNLTLSMYNPYGYLSAVDYPALVFYGVMTAIYTIYAFAWIVMMACAYKDLVRLQFWVLAVILLGFLEKMLFVSEYGSINAGNDSSGIIMIAEIVSAIKRALSRMLLIIVAMGFGTVKPRLGDSLGKVVVIGIIYTILACMDGIIRARNETFVSRDAASTVTLALLLIFDSFVMYWIFTSIVDTRRTLRLRKNYVKLSMYNHFAYTLIFAIVASLGFIVWALVTLNFPAGNCLTDWKEVWLRECFWHVLFAFILLIVMIIWRPSANRNRFAYSLVNDEDDVEEEEPEQGPNKNFDTVKMRQMTKPESEVPPLTSQAEDDLRWVEENLPTTAMDKALPLILDSDEEVMTTKFEISKMN